LPFASPQVSPRTPGTSRKALLLATLTITMPVKPPPLQHVRLLPPRSRSLLALLAGALALFPLCGCSNNPYRDNDPTRSVLYGTITEDPKSLDPSFAYDVLSLSIIGPVYETLLQYHFLKRPYQLVPSLAEGMPERIVEEEDEFTEGIEGPGLDNEGAEHADEKGRPSRHGYQITIRNDLRFQDDPCFEATGGKGRKVKSDDLIYAFKRLADPTVTSPVRSILGEKIVGLDRFFDRNRQIIQEQRKEGEPLRADLSLPVRGLRKIDDHTFEVYLTEPYPQFLYWLAMPFTTPIPREAVEYYDSTQFSEREDFKDHPVGTGAYLVKEYRKGHRIVLARSPNFHQELYPDEGEPSDREAGLLEDAGRRLPFVDEQVLTVVKESIPRWRLFRQGYLDGSGVPKEAFDRVITPEGSLSQEMRDRGVRMSRAKRLATYYCAFNMDDPLVGANRKLRQAICCAIDSAEYIDLHQNGLGVVAQSPLPPGIFGHEPDYRNQFRTYDLDFAKRLLAEAGYEGGLDPETGGPLTIRYDTSGRDPAARQATRWMVRQFERLNIKLDVIENDWNTHQQKADDGNFQIIRFGWIADYPDPENFLFLLHSENKRPSVNYANYDNPEYDGLFDQMKSMSNMGAEGERRLEIIRRMIKILERDSPWVPDFHPERYSLSHQWCGNMKAHGPGQNLVKYRKVEPSIRAKLREEWNRPDYRAISVLLGLLILGALPALWVVRRRRA